jgi:23S rRNA (cytidine1920-2'-O)/16S rRNA (cytidine1409-2'-O)-methyltransferase
MTQSEEGDRRRLDAELVRRGLFPSRAQARAAIDAGKVILEGVVSLKAGQPVTSASCIEAEPAHPWVSRGGVKLAFALEVFDIDPRGATCLDIGASTGGFTQVLLAAGAQSVVSVDVGHDQLHEKLRQDPRVINLEGCDARSLDEERFQSRFEVRPSLIVCDASFISLSKLLETPLRLAAEKADLVALFKPQFEVGRAHVGKGGVVTDEPAVARSRSALADWLGALGWPILSWRPSPIRGGDGNVEHLFHARRAISERTR